MWNKKKVKKELTHAEKKSMLTFFIILFPSMLITCLTVFSSSIEFSLIAISLFFFQGVLLKNFIGDHYKEAE